MKSETTNQKYLDYIMCLLFTGFNHKILGYLFRCVFYNTSLDVACPSRVQVRGLVFAIEMRWCNLQVVEPGHQFSFSASLKPPILTQCFSTVTDSWACYSHKLGDQGPVRSHWETWRTLELPTPTCSLLCFPTGMM